MVDTMLPYLTEQYGNPHSRTHLYGWEAEEAVEAARAQVGAQFSIWRHKCGAVCGAVYMQCCVACWDHGTSGLKQ